MTIFTNLKISNEMSKTNPIYIFGGLIVLFILAYFLISAPRDFPKGIIFTVEEGESLRTVSLHLKEKNIIRSRVLFEVFVILYGGEKRIIPADYLFENKTSAALAARRISKGERHLAPVKLTIPEGFNAEDIAEAAAAALPSFSKEAFLISARGREGSLFPDTYFFFTDANEEDVLKSLSENFNKKLAALEREITESGRSEEDIIKMASVIEREAKGSSDRDIISGILWKRISIGIPLQADAAPETYQSRGLPKNPISNPGLSSIKAAIYPKSSSYLYYLHDKEGNIHFAKSFVEHRRNIEKYLK